MKRIVVTRALTMTDLAAARDAGLGTEHGTVVDAHELIAIARAPSLTEQWSSHERARALAADAWAFTSRHAVAALADVLHFEPSLVVPRCYAVGPATATALAALGIRPHLAGGTGRQLALSIARARAVRRTFYWRGDVTTREFAATLRASDVSVDEWVVYRKHERSVSIDSRGIAALVVLSPSQVRAVARALSGALDRTTPIVAIGPTTAAEVRAVFGRRAHIAPIPTLPSLFATVARALDLDDRAADLHRNPAHGHAESSLARA